MDENLAREIQTMNSNRPSPELVSFVADKAAVVIPCVQDGRAMGVVHNKYGALPCLPSFVSFLVTRSGVGAGTLLSSLVFMNRLHSKLANIAKGMACTAHRIFLATLIVTSKSIHDTSPKNKHWTRYAAYFDMLEINLMEKQLLLLMNYNVIITPEDLTFCYLEFKSTLRPPPPLHLHQTNNDADLPMYATMCYQSNSSLGSDMSITSFSSSGSSVATISDMTDLENYYKYPSAQVYYRIRRTDQD